MRSRSIARYHTRWDEIDHKAMAGRERGRENAEKRERAERTGKAEKMGENGR